MSKSSLLQTHSIIYLLVVATIGAAGYLIVTVTPTIQVEALHSLVHRITNTGTSEEVMEDAPQPLALYDRVDVNEIGRALITFPNLRKVELLRSGSLTFTEVTTDTSPLVAVYLHRGVLSYRHEEDLAARFEVTTEFARIIAIGTRLLVVREAHTPLEWVIALDAQAQELIVQALRSETRSLQTGRAIWLAPIPYTETLSVQALTPAKIALP